MCTVAQKLGERYVKYGIVQLPDWFNKSNVEIETKIKNLDIEAQLNMAREAIYLEKIYHTEVEYKQFEYFFKTINLVIANPMSKPTLINKIYVFFSLFKDYPLILFNEQLCKDLATASPFFPSAFDVEKILQSTLKSTNEKLMLLRKLI